MQFRQAVVLSALLLVFAAAADDDDHAGHDHGASNLPAGLEWAGIFETPEDKYMWTAQKVEGAYADPSMKILVFPVNAANEEALHALETEAEFAMAMNCWDKAAGSTIVPTIGVCYNLKFEEDMWQSLFKIDASGTAAIAVFAQHFPTEFEATAHYLKDDHGHDIEPLAQMPEGDAHSEAVSESDEDSPWGAVLGASILVNIVTLIGVIFFVPVLSRVAIDASVQAVLSGFAAGAILACAFFLLLFEATHLIGVGWTKEVDVLWRWGTMILAGFVLPAFIDCIVHVIATARAPKAAAQPAQAEKPADQAEGQTIDLDDVVAKDAQPTTDVVPAAEPLNMEEANVSRRARLLGGVLIGDFCHNLCDGFFIGAAFKGCGTDFGWTVTMGTVIHEFPQELADFAILTGPECGLSKVAALIANFVSGLSVILGALIVMAMDVDDKDTGLLLAFGGGVYIHVAATECMPRIYLNEVSTRMRALSLAAFVLGAVIIGLVLLDHEHCVPVLADGEVDPHAGHGH